MYGISVGLQVSNVALIGQQIGKKDINEARDYYLKVQKFSVLVTLIVYITFMLTSDAYVESLT
jgi:Na+-driven multidrug efflux pump